MNRTTQGFTLVEAMLALAVIGIVVSSLVPGITGMLTVNNGERIRRDAVSAARTTVQALVASGIPTLPMKDLQVRRLTLNGRNYDVTVTYCSNPTFCAPATSRHLKLEVNENGRRLYSVETVVSII